MNATGQKIQLVKVSPIFIEYQTSASMLVNKLFSALVRARVFLIIARKMFRMSGFAFYLLFFQGLGKLNLCVMNAGKVSCFRI